MFNKKIKIKNYKSWTPTSFFSLVCLVSLLILLSPLETKATIVDDVLLAAVKSVIEGIITVLQYIAGFILYLGAQLIAFMFQFNTAITDFPIVIVGWQIVRDIANLGFVIAFIVVAFMTILRVSSYNAQKMLPKLIASIILVNFSLTIAGFILDFTNVLTKFFVDYSLRDQNQAASAIADALQPQRYFNSNNNNLSGALDEYRSSDLSEIRGVQEEDQLQLGHLLSLFTIMIFTYFMAFLLLGNALMLLTRFIYLAVLLVLSPIPWVFGVIPVPQIKGKSTDWWGKFLEWAFVAPILSFFLYLTLVTAMDLQNILENNFKSLTSTPEYFTKIESFWLLVAHTLIMGGFLAAGLLTSKSMGGKLAEGAIGFGIKTANSAKKWALSSAISSASGTLSKTGRKIMTLGAGSDKSGKSWGEKLGESKIAKTPFVGALLRGVAGASTKAKEKSQEVIEKSRKKYSSLSKDVLKNRINSQLATKGLGSITEDDVGAALALAEKGGWEELSKETKEKLITAIKRSGAVKKLAAFDPIAAVSTGIISMEEAVGRVEKPEFLSPDILKQIAPYLRPSQRKEIGEKGSTKQKEAVVEGLREAFISSSIPRKNEDGTENSEFVKEKKNVEMAFRKLEEQKEKLNKVLKDYADAKDMGDTALMKILQKERDVIKENIKNLTKALTEGGSWNELGFFGLDKNGNPITQIISKTPITIKPPETKPGEEENEELQRRIKAMEVRNDISKQTIWQGKNLFKNSNEENNLKGEEI